MFYWPGSSVSTPQIAHDRVAKLYSRKLTVFEKLRIFHAVSIETSGCLIVALGNLAKKAAPTRSL